MNRCDKVRANQSEDLISSLHDDITSHILSRLSTKEAVQTSVLSKDWRLKWTHIYNVNIDERIHQYRINAEPTFPDFIDRVLSQTLDIKHFSLKTVSKFNTNHLETWISTVLEHKVENFDIRVATLSDDNKVEHIVLSFRLLTSSTSLKTLTFILPCVFKIVEAQSCFPNLIWLNLYCILFQNENSNIEKVSLNFPVMKSLSTMDCEWRSLKYLDIYAPSLNEFYTHDTYNVNEVRDYSVKVFAPRLTMFKTLSSAPENIVVEGGSQVKHATLGHYYFPYDGNLLTNFGLRIEKLLNGFSNLEELSLHGLAAQALQAAGLPFCSFNKLRRLWLSTLTTNTQQVFEFLKATPTLKYLYVHSDYWNAHDYDGMELIPSCIPSHLEEIGISLVPDFSSREPQYKFLHIMLTNGGELKKLSFFSLHDDEQRKTIVEQLSEFPRKQTCLTLSFIIPYETFLITA